jgi:plasmid maintenance system antidote protein VapI
MAKKMVKYANNVGKNNIGNIINGNTNITTATDIRSNARNGIDPAFILSLEDFKYL